MRIADKLTTIAENEQKVYEAGEQAEYDRFWDSYQNNGNRTNYKYAFSGLRWKPYTTFIPKHDIIPSDAANMFVNFNDTSDAGLDMVKYLDDLKVILDLSTCGDCSNAFTGANISRLGTVDLSVCKSTYNMFYNWKLTTIDNLILTENTVLDNMFYYATVLKNLTISGVIAKNFRVSWCTELTHDSLVSIISALKDYSGTTTTCTLTLGTKNLAKLTDQEKAIATEKGWTLA